MDKNLLKSIVEAILFVSEEPLDAGEILKTIQRAEDQAPALQTENAQEATALESSEANEAAAPLFIEEDAPASTDELDAPQNLSVEDQLALKQQSEDQKLIRLDVQQAINELVAEYETNGKGFELVNVAHGFQFRTRPEFAPYIKAMNKVNPTRLSQASLEVLSMVAYRQPITRADVDEIRGVDSGGVLKTLLEKDMVKVVGKKEEPGKPLLYGTTEKFLEIFSLRGLQDLPTLKDLKQIEEEMHQASAPGATVELEQDYFEESETQAADQDFAAQLQVAEREEKEAFDELDQSLKELEGLEGRVLDAFSKKEESANSTDENLA